MEGKVWWDDSDFPSSTWKFQLGTQKYRLQPKCSINPYKTVIKWWSYASRWQRDQLRQNLKTWPGSKKRALIKQSTETAWQTGTSCTRKLTLNQNPAFCLLVVSLYFGKCNLVFIIAQVLYVTAHVITSIRLDILSWWTIVTCPVGSNLSLPLQM